MQSLFDVGLEVVPPSRVAACRAVETDCISKTTVYDAAFAALAESLTATLVTADERLARKLEAFAGVRFLLPYYLTGLGFCI